MNCDIGSHFVQLSSSVTDAVVVNCSDGGGEDGIEEGSSVKVLVKTLVRNSEGERGL